MRRKEREIVEEEKIREILDVCDCCRIALLDGKIPYIVPLNFGYKLEDGRLIFYFHGAPEGKKMELVRSAGYAGFELDCAHELLTHEKACGHSFYYQSIIGHGRILVVEDREEKEEGLRQIMWQLTQKTDWDFDARALEATAVLKLEAEEYSGKEHLRQTAGLEV